MALEVLVRACLVSKKGNEALRAANEARNICGSSKLLSGTCLHTLNCGEVLALCQDGADAESRSLLLVAKTKQAELRYSGTRVDAA